MLSQEWDELVSRETYWTWSNFFSRLKNTLEYCIDFVRKDLVKIECLVEDLYMVLVCIQITGFRGSGGSGFRGFGFGATSILQIVYIFSKRRKTKKYRVRKYIGVIRGFRAFTIQDACIWLMELENPWMIHSVHLSYTYSYTYCM